jgi:Domain of Unknown Function (DUF1259)
MSAYISVSSKDSSPPGRAASCNAGIALCAARNKSGRKKEKAMKHPLTLFALGAALLLSFPVHAADIDWKKVDAALGKTAAVSGEVHRYGLPRSDLRVTLDGIAIKPALALGGWVAFAPMHGEAMVMGDLVLLDTEITPVMTKLLDGGLEITAIHNHILRAAPATFYMHIAGHGDPEKMARRSARHFHPAARRRSIRRRRPPVRRPQSISTPRSSTKRWARRARPTAVSTNLVFRGAIQSRKVESR